MQDPPSPLPQICLRLFNCCVVPYKKDPLLPFLSMGDSGERKKGCHGRRVCRLPPGGECGSSEVLGMPGLCLPSETTGAIAVEMAALLC